MTTRSRFVLPLLGALVLGATLVLHFFLSAPPELEPPVEPPPSVKREPVEKLAPAPVSPPPTYARPAPVQAQVPTQLAEGPATVVPIGPGDVVPEPEVENPPPQQNDPIQEELPQTPAWKHGKTERITEVLDRDMGRLEAERQAALERGDEARAQELEVQIARNRARLAKLREELGAMADSVRSFPTE